MIMAEVTSDNYKQAKAEIIQTMLYRESQHCSGTTSSSLPLTFSSPPLTFKKGLFRKIMLLEPAEASQFAGETVNDAGVTVLMVLTHATAEVGDDWYLHLENELVPAITKLLNACQKKGNFVAINAKDTEGHTALMWLGGRRMPGREKLTTLFLSAGADPSIKSHNGKDTQEYYYKDHPGAPLILQARKIKSDLKCHLPDELANIVVQYATDSFSARVDEHNRKRRKCFHSCSIT